MKPYLLACLLLLSLPGYSQGEANHWYFGFNGGLQFTSGNPTAVSNGQLATIEGCTTISSLNGALLFYTNGQNVWNKDHQLMANGGGLFGDLSSSQAAVIVKKPGTDFTYYIFTTNPFPTNGGFRYSEVDLTANSGLGAVTLKNVLLSDSTCEKVAVVKQANGTDFWAVIHTFGSDAFQSYPITADGISQNYSLSNTGAFVDADTDFANAIGYMKISPDGKKLVVCHSFLTIAELFDFDTATGLVTNPIVISNEGLHVYGAEFSTSSDVLYLTAVDEKKLFQFDLRANDIPATKLLLADLDTSLGALQLGPNGKIYLAMAESNQLTVIENPDLLGSACGLNINEIYIPGTCMLGLPSYNASYFDLTISAENLCAGSPTNFTVNAGQAMQSVTWNFGDNTTSVEFSPSHAYTSGGNYTVTATITHGNSTVVKSEIIAILTLPETHAPSAQSVCISSNASYQLDENNDEILGPQSADEFSVAYYASQDDAASGTNLLANEIILQVGTATFFATVTNNNTGCKAVTSFTINASSQPTAATPTDFIICVGYPYDGNAVFDLTIKNLEILGTQDSELYVVTYHLKQAEAESGLNPIANSYTSLSMAETLFARVSSFSDSCYAVAPLNLFVSEQPKVAEITNYVVCDTTPFDGFAPFDLLTKDAEALNGLPAANFNVTYHISMNDAENNLAPIFGMYTNTQSLQTIFVRVESHRGCMAISAFNLDVKNCDLTIIPFNYPKFFTPNGDGQHDAWQIISSEASSFSISIFDRNGKLMRTMPGNAIGWDGTIDGQQLSPNDYWFVASDKNKEYRGHFSLMR